MLMLLYCRYATSPMLRCHLLLLRYAYADILRRQMLACRAQAA